MNECIVECPCCGKQLKISIEDNGDIAVVFFYEEISEEEAFMKHGICLAVKGGENIAK